MRILHISDFHFIPKARSEFDRVVEKMVESLSKQEPIDLIVFSGDLINKDASVEQFREAAECLFSPLLSALDLDKTRLLICPGNHDLKRGNEIPMVVDSLKTKTQSTDLNAFCDDPTQLSLSLTRFEAYNKFIKEYFGDTLDIQQLYCTAIREIAGKRVGLISINSAWRSEESEKDRGNLLYPSRYIKEAIDKVKGCNLVLCNMHHAVSDFKEFIEQEIENSIFEDCHILFTGHYHKARLSSILSTNGLLHSVGYATFNIYDKTSSYGYLVLTIDEETFDVKVESFPFTNNHFIADDPIFTVLPMSADKRASNDFRKVMKKQLTVFREKADNLFVTGRTADTAGHTFSMLFSEPVIKDKSSQELMASRKSGERISLEDIEEAEKSTIIFGRKKSGRTSLMYKMMIDLLLSYESRKIVPYYFNYKEINSEPLYLERRLRDFLSLSKADLNKKLETDELVLLIDDIDFSDESFINGLLNELLAFSKVRFIATSEETLTNQRALMYFEEKEVDSYYIHDVTPREVHQLTTRWPNMSNVNKRRYEEKIVKILKQMHLPFNYWTVSLFLWIFEKTDASNIHNNFELINLYIDEILDKKSLITDKFFKIDYEDLRSYLASLAEFLLFEKNHRVSYRELVNFTDKYRESNIKFVEQTKDIIELLLNRGVLVEEDYSSNSQGQQKLFTFRLNGVFEYFIALRLAESPELIEMILGDDKIFFSFGTELELYAGFNKDDIEAVREIFKKTQTVLRPLSEKEDYYDIDGRLGHEVVINPNNVRVTGVLFDGMTDISQEDVEELLPVTTVPLGDSRVAQKEILAEILPSSDNIEKALFILSRMYRNSNACNNLELSNAIIDYVLTGVCNLGFLITEEARLSGKAEEYEGDVVALMNNYMPIIIQTFLYDAICQQNLIRVFEDKLTELMAHPEGNELRLFVVAFMLVDLNPATNYHYFAKVIPYISNNRLLRFAVLNKVTLLMLNNAGDKSLINKLKHIAEPIMREFREYLDVQSLMKEIEDLKNKNRLIKAGVLKDYKE